MKFVKVLIWFGFTALLAVSVPKVAWVFRSYESPGALYVSLAGFSFDALWLIPLFVAVCIDALTLALTYTVSIDKARASQFSMWAFVALLCGLSYYCNLLYNDVPLRANPFIVAVTPFILAGVPLFALCYTLILSRVGNQGETLEQKAARLESEKSARKRIAAARQGRFTDRINGAITGAGDIAKHAGKTFTRASETLGDVQEDTTEISGQDATVNARQDETPAASMDTSPNGAPAQLPAQERNTDKLTRLTESGATENSVINAGNNEEITNPGATDLMGSDSLTSQKSISIKAAAQLLGVSESYVRTCVNNKKLRTAPRNKKLVLKASVDALITARMEMGKQEHIMPGKAPLKIVESEPDTTEQNTPVHLGMIEKRMYAILAEKPDELQALLHLASELDIDALTETLQQRYNQYAEYITQERVTNILNYARQDEANRAPALSA